MAKNTHNIHSGIRSDLFNRTVNFLFHRVHYFVPQSSIAQVNEVHIIDGEVVYEVSDTLRGNSLTAEKINRNFRSVVRNLRTLEGPWINRYCCHKKIEGDTIRFIPLLDDDKPQYHWVTTEAEMKELEKVLK